MVEDVDIQLFVGLGLTEVQAKVYFSLLETGEAGVDVLSKQTKIPQLDVYGALLVLLKLNIVQEIT
jgi:sugar-specific transcriptional regulator TrmB